ncbi:hypothetical protein ABZ777_30505, partial [Micromonospora parva]|uniref:hypothetical protein n=1 Tax=Micromonospora parva TaxID=1464048 RepID=UPI0033F46198
MKHDEPRNIGLTRWKRAGNVVKVPGAESAGDTERKAPVGVPLSVVLWLVCGCSLRTQQGACKASANMIYTPDWSVFAGW